MIVLDRLFDGGLVLPFMTVVRDFVRLFGADRHILDYEELHSVCNKVNLHCYHSELEQRADKAVANLGDELSPIIVSFLCNKRGVPVGKDIAETRHLYAVGSILLMGHQNATVWGTGLPYAPYFCKRLTHRAMFRNLDIRCVRGPLTRKVLLRMGHKCPELYGDPAVLMPLIYQPKVRERRDVGFIPHYSMETQMLNKVGAENIISMKTKDYLSVIDRICSCKKVVSSSLHGIILAETYGIPAVFLQDRADALSFKYADWYFSTDRTDWAVAHSIDDALSCDVDLPQNIERLQNNLIDTFPVDLWAN